MSWNFRSLRCLIAGLGLIAIIFAVRANHVSFAQQDRAPANIGPDAAQLQQLRQSAINFLKTNQSADGSWTSENAPGISALVVASLLQSGLTADDPTVAKGLEHLKTFVRKDGGIYFEGSTHRNYETSIAMMAFQAANTNGQYDETLEKAAGFLRHLQWDQGEGLESTDTGYGGAGYGSHERPDLSNTSFLIEALRTAGAGADDEAIQKALIFVSRSQNLESAQNTTPFAAKVNDGGFYYTPAAGGTSQAGTTDNGGLRSYGSMTYAGLKSMIYAGLTSEDDRVKAALEWIQRHYTLTENPGMGQQGLYYYYHTFAKALAVLGIDHLEETGGTRHDWRKDLVEHLATLQRSNGSWVNRADRWYEGDPNLSTAYTLMALSYCEPKSASDDAN